MQRFSRLRLFALALSATVVGCAPTAAPLTPTSALVPTAQPPLAPTAVVAAPKPTLAPTAAPTAAPKVTAPAPKPTTAPTLALTATAADQDRQFIDMMVPHHEGALEMAKIAQERAERPEIKAMAAEILRTQSAEIAELKSWRLAWFGSDVTPPMSEMPMIEGLQMRGAHAAGQVPAATMDMAAEVEKLRAAPDPFDIAFISAMVPHHQDAVDASRATFQRNARPEIRTLATAIVNAQAREIAMMEQWRREWSGTAPGMEQAPVDEHAGEH
jgi:uncharacterized protein (DUF305 family)